MPRQRPIEHEGRVLNRAGCPRQSIPVREAVDVRAERLVCQRLEAMGWTQQDLAARRKGHPRKVQLAAAVRAGTTMPLAWIAQRLAMGSRGYLTWLLSRQNNAP